MKPALLFLVLLTLCFPGSVRAAFYQWVDAQGVTHFTDNQDKIPAKYQKKAKKLTLPEEPAQAAPAGQQDSVPDASPQEQTFGGQPEKWWRGRFTALRAELDRQQQGLREKQDKLVELRRQRVIYTRAQDREAVNSMQAEISVTELRITELQNQLSELDRQATRAAVPVEWRQ
jgi:hypothetical protein